MFWMMPRTADALAQPHVWDYLVATIHRPLGPNTGEINEYGAPRDYSNLVGTFSSLNNDF
jgi:hypothetical protein